MEHYCGCPECTGELALDPPAEFYPYDSPTDAEVPVDPAHATEDAGYIERTHDLRPLDFSGDEPWEWVDGPGDYL